VSEPRLYKETSLEEQSVKNSVQFSVGDLKKNYKSECEDLTCELKTLCVLSYSDIGSVRFEVIVPVLKSVDRKRLVKAL
jgi:hypothetical protein